MTSVSLEEKRLKQLKQQLFGKEKPLSSYPTGIVSGNSHRINHAVVEASVVNPISMKRDLMKIASFSLIALAIQFVLFFASRQGLLKLFWQ